MCGKYNKMPARIFTYIRIHRFILRRRTLCNTRTENRAPAIFYGITCFSIYERDFYTKLLSVIRVSI